MSPPEVPTRVHATDRDEVGALAAVVLEIARQGSPEGVLATIARRARDVVSASEDVGITLLRSRGRTEPAVPGGSLASACGPLLFETDLGLLTGAQTVLIPDTRDEVRWPDFALRAASLGIYSVLVAPLVGARATVGVVSWYATAPRAFDEGDAGAAAAFATHAGIALAQSVLEANLRVGLQTREEIGRAVGILMERHRVTAADAFGMLVVASQHAHRKLRDVAAWMNETGEDPSALTRQRD